MNLYEVFCPEDFSALFRAWRDCGIEHVGITMGPLELYYHLDIYRSTIDMHAYNAGEVNPGTLEWCESKFTVFRCVYGLMRIHGLRNWAWETANDFQDSDFNLYQEHFKVYGPHMRVLMPKVFEEPFIIENLWSNSYMMLFPQLPPERPHAVYPSGDTTIWVDSFLNMNPTFCPEII